MIVDFYDFALDTDSGSLSRAGREIPLERAPRRLLAYLVRHRDRVVSKEEILSVLWGSRALGETSIARCVSILRAALDDRDAKRIVATIWGEGYRFVAPVRELPDPSSQVQAQLDRILSLEARRGNPNEADVDGVLELARLYVGTGQLVAARSVLIDLVHYSRSISDPTLFVDAVVAHELILQVPEDLEEGSVRAHLLSRALELSRSDLVLYGRALACVAAAHNHVPLATRESWAREALRLVESSDPRTRVEVTLNAHRALQTLGTLERREALMQSMERERSRVEDAHLLQLWCRSRIFDALESGDMELLDRQIDELRSLAAAAGADASITSTLESAESTRAALLGNYADAARHSQNARETLHLTESWDDVNSLTGILNYAVNRDRMDLHSISKGVPLSQRAHPLFPALKASMLYDFGLIERARNELERCSIEDIRSCQRNSLWAIRIGACAGSASRLGDLERSRVCLELLAPHSGSMISWHGVLMGPVDLYLGMLSATLDDWKEAGKHFDRALGQTRRLGARAIHAAVLLEWGVALFRRGDAEDVARAVDLLERAVVIAEPIGAKRIHVRAQAFLPWRTRDSVSREDRAAGARSHRRS